jgi:CheY-like chemotaxis protein
MRTHAPRWSGEYLADLESFPPRILLAEDDAEMRALVSGDLRRAGYVVVECADGAALLRRLESVGCSQGLGVDLVVADVRMPEMTGLEVLNAPLVRRAGEWP